MNGIFSILKEINLTGKRIPLGLFHHEENVRGLQANLGLYVPYLD